MDTQTLTFAASPFVPVAIGFFGLGTGYFIWGGQALFGFPKANPEVNKTMGMWGFWMPGFMQFITGVYLFAGLTLFGTFRTPALYMAALAFVAYGVHWFAIGWNRSREGDPRVMVGVTVAYFLLSILGIIVFFHAGDHPVGGVFIGLTGVYAADFFAVLSPDLPTIGRWAERATGIFRLGTGFWLIYLTFAVALNFILNYGLPL